MKSKVRVFREFCTLVLWLAFASFREVLHLYTFRIAFYILIDFLWSSTFSMVDLGNEHRHL